MMFRRGDRVKIFTDGLGKGEIAEYIRCENTRHLVRLQGGLTVSVVHYGLELVSEAPKVYHMGHDSAMEVSLSE